MNMEITEITIHPTNEDLVRACEHCFRQLFHGRGDQSHARPHGTFRLISRQEAERRHHGELAYPATRIMIQRVILAEYEKIVGDDDLENPA